MIAFDVVVIKEKVLWKKKFYLGSYLIFTQIDEK
jgi:hypothetical protein